MPYASGRRCLDADSHVMEPADWLTPYADPGIRERLRSLPGVTFDRSKAALLADQRAADPDKQARAQGRLMGTGYLAYGAWDAADRSRALDTLGFDAQLVFSTFSAHQFSWSKDPDVLYGGIRAHNRALADFCSDDPRLLAVALVPFDDPNRAVAEVDAALELGCRSVLVSSAPAGGRSPAHTDNDPVWERLADIGMPFMTHIGTGGKLVPDGYRNNGRPVPPDFLGGGENVRSKDYLGIHTWPQTLLSMMALDGVFERFPTLRGGCIEQGATWVVTMLRLVDLAQSSFKKGEPDLAALPDRASDYIRRAVKFTPFPGEDVGWLIDQIGAELLLFSSDYPHLEGGRDPIAKFEATMADVSDADRDRFYADNLADLLGPMLSGG